MRVLSVTHGPSVPGGVFEHEVEESGHELEHWRVPEGGAPDPASSYDAVMVFGGSQHPDQDDHFAWLGHEEEFLRDVLAERVPVFGVCLGAQMLARAAGAKVGPAREPEIGWYEVELTREGSADPVLGVMPSRATVFQWHSYTYEIPAGGSELAAQPGLHAGIPARAARMGHSVPRRDHPPDARRMDRGGPRRAPRARRGAAR